MSENEEDRLVAMEFAKGMAGNQIRVGFDGEMLMIAVSDPCGSATVYVKRPPPGTSVKDAFMEALAGAVASGLFPASTFAAMLAGARQAVEEQGGQWDRPVE